jgi:methyl-accepting chemotaxis protein
MTLTIGRKLVGLAALGAALALAVGAVGYETTRGAAARASELLGTEATIVENAGHARAHVLGLRRFEKDLFLNLGDAAKEADYVRKWEDQRRRLVARLDRLEAVATRPAERERVTGMRADLATYGAGMQAVRDRIKAGGIQTPQQGNVAIGDVKAAIHSMEARAEELVVEAGARMAAGEASLTASARRSLAIILALVLLAVGAGLATSLLIARGITRALGRAVEALEAVAAGDLTPRLDVRGGDELARMADSVNVALTTMRDVLGAVRLEAAQAATASRQLAAASEQVAEGAQGQAASLQETGASLEEITGTVRLTADNVAHADALSAASRRAAERGGSVVRDAVAAMTEINQSSKRIVDITTTIDEIAFQTNLLALNAAVEAARAGEQGRGFAVVATEVRSLAQRSATAAKEVKALIEDSVAKVEAGSALVNKSGITLTDIVSSVQQVTDIIGAIAAASKQQSVGIESVNRAVSEMDQVVQANAAQTEEMSSTAQALAAQAIRLEAQVARFTVADPALASAPPTRVALYPRRPGPERRPAAVGTHARSGRHDEFEDF